MAVKRFIDRKGEMTSLGREYGRKEAGLIVVFGRRRVGKTRLIRESLKGADFAYYLAAVQPDAAQVIDLKTTIADFLDDGTLRELDIRDWKGLFGYLEKVWPRERRLVLAIDEVTYITKNNPAFTSLLQRFWDGFLSGTRTKLILCGSLVGLMARDVLSSGSPLYGRRALDVHVRPLLFRHAQEFMKGVGFEDRLRFFAVLGGMPKYLEMVEGDFDSFIIDRMFDPNGFFYREGLYLLSEGFSESATYSNILRAVASGASSAARIGGHVGMDTRRLSSYLHILEGLGFLERRFPAGLENGRGSQFRVGDNFLEFWFRFVQENRSAVELGRGRELYAGLRNDINAFIGGRFEDVCRQYMEESGWGGPAGVGRWWRNLPDKKMVMEIDLLGKRNGRLGLAECKWRERVDGISLHEQLAGKAVHIPFPEQREYFLFARSFSRKGRQPDAHYVDLKDLEAFFSKPPDEPPA